MAEAYYNAASGMLTVEAFQMMAARAFGLEVPKRRSKPNAEDTDDANGIEGID